MRLSKWNGKIWMTSIKLGKLGEKRGLRVYEELDWQPILIFHSSFWGGKRSAVHNGLQWMVAIGGKWHKTKRSPESVQFFGGTFLHCFFLRISSIYELGHLKYHKRKVKVYYCFKCKSVLWMIFILVSGWQNTFEVECWTYLLCSFVFGAVCTIQAWKYLLHTLDWRLRRKYLLDLYRNVSPL